MREGEETFQQTPQIQNQGPSAHFPSGRGLIPEGGENLSNQGTPGSSQHPPLLNFNPSVTAALERRPTISFIAFVPDPITAELERLQFLFLLRLKDSLVDLKSSAMKFLSLTAEAAAEEVLQITSPMTPRLIGEGRQSTLVGEEGEGGGERGEEGEGGEEMGSSPSVKRRHNTLVANEGREGGGGGGGGGDEAIQD